MASPSSTKPYISSRGFHQMRELVTEQIHMTFSQKWSRSTEDAMVLRGTNASSNHHLLYKLQLKSNKTMKKNSEQIFNSSRLKDPAEKL